jgi:hypothetical protein
MMITHFGTDFNAESPGKLRISGSLGARPGSTPGRLEDSPNLAELDARLDALIRDAVNGQLKCIEARFARTYEKRARAVQRRSGRRAHRVATLTRAGPDGDDPAEPPGELEIASSEFQEAA